LQKISNYSSRISRNCKSIRAVPNSILCYSAEYE